MISAAFLIMHHHPAIFVVDVSKGLIAFSCLCIISNKYKTPSFMVEEITVLLFCVNTLQMILSATVFCDGIFHFKAVLMLIINKQFIYPSGTL